MSRTRHQSSGDDPSSANERHLSNPKILGLNVSLRYIGACAPVRTEEQIRNAVWLFNYARALGLTANQVSDELGLSRAEIGDALTNPNAEADLLSRFIKALEPVRKRWLAGRPKIAETAVTRIVRDGVTEAFEDSVFELIQGPYRCGKSTPFRELFFTEYMDRAIYVKVPDGNDMQGFCGALTQASGVSSANHKVTKLKEQALAIFATGIIQGVFLEESHYLFGKDSDTVPPKIDFLRHCYDAREFHRQARGGKGGLGFAMEATPQFGDHLNAALDGAWAAGQFEGRLRRCFCPDTLTDAEIEAIARCQAPDFNAAAIRKLIVVTKASPGLLGFMTNVVGKVRFLARKKSIGITESLVQTAAQEMLRGTRIEAEAKKLAAKRATE